MSTVVSSEPLNGRVCSNGTRRAIVTVDPGTYGGVEPGAPVPPAVFGKKPNAADAGMLAWPDAGRAVHSNAANVVTAENASSLERVTLTRVR